MRTAVVIILCAGLLAALSVPPAAAQPRTHVVRPGENLYRIALRYGVTVAALMQANGLRSDRILAGQVLRIPPSRGVSPGRATVSVAAAAPAPPLDVGAEVVAVRPVRLRRGPRSYHTTLAIVAAGTAFRVAGADGPWYQVRLADGMEGWVASRDLQPPAGARPEDAAGEAVTSRAAGVRGADLVREAMGYLGIPYVWGGESARGVDCSGFIYVVFSTRLPQLARLRSFDYFRMGVPVVRDELRPGDLVFFTTYAPGASHVGIYVGEGRFLHASSGARRVLATPLDDPYYAARYLGARRLVAP